MISRYPLTLPILAVLLAACSTTSAGAPTTPTTPANTTVSESQPMDNRPVGNYSSAHKIMVVCDNPCWCEEEVVDRLTISEAPHGDIAVSIELIQANAHMCSFEGTLKQGDIQRWEWLAPEGEEECHLVLTWRDADIEIHSQGCRDFCGARASLEAVFSYPPDEPGP